jgi:hypothetical protein
VKWTKEKPAKHGYYWARKKLTGEINLVRVFEFDGLCVDHFGNPDFYLLERLSLYDEWQGPITPDE